MRFFLPLLLLAVAAPAAAYECTFAQECYEAEACGESTFALDVLVEDQILSAEFGEVKIVAIREKSDLVSIFGSGEGAEYMLSISKTAARLSAHLNDGPQAITYLGTCEGAF